MRNLIKQLLCEGMEEMEYNAMPVPIIHKLKNYLLGKTINHFLIDEIIVTGVYGQRFNFIYVFVEDLRPEDTGEEHSLRKVQTNRHLIRLVKQYFCRTNEIRCELYTMDVSNKIHKDKIVGVGEFIVD